MICVSRDPGVRLRDIAPKSGSRSAQHTGILSELVDEGYVVRAKEGRRNRYSIGTTVSLRHPLVEDREVGDLLKALVG